jgi:hypothetical protein
MEDFEFERQRSKVGGQIAEKKVKITEYGPLTATGFLN